MEEKPKSIWKKPWRGPLAWLLAWAGLMLALALIFWVALSMGAPRPRPAEDARLFWSVAAGVTVLMLLVAFIRWACCLRNLKRVLFGLACLATLIALFYAEEDWRGWHAWQNFKQAAEAKGAKLEFKDYIPAAVPEDQNFALAPVIASCYATMLDKTGHEIRPRDTNVVDRLQLPLTLDNMDGPTNGNWEVARLTNLKPWQDYYRRLAQTTNEFPVAAQPQTAAEDVLLALSKYDGTVEEMRAAAKLPYARFPLEYDKENPAEILLPHLAAMKRCSKLLQMRTLAELQAGQSEKALADSQLNFRLTESIHPEPFIISQLVRFAMLAITVQPIYEGLAKHQWTDTQLVALEVELAKLDCLADDEYTINAEPVMHIKLIDYLEQKRRRAPEFFGMLDSNNQQNNLNNSPLITAFYLAPKGWFYQNEVRLVKLNQEWNLPIVDTAQRTVSPQAAMEAMNKANKLSNTPYNFFARLLLPALGNYSEKSAYAQSTANLARTAIALERYRLAHGEYPESTAALVPQFMTAMPQDVIGGGPLQYRRTNDGLFVLYSIGWNEKDDGGVTSIPPHGSHANHIEGDWVWRYPM